MKEPLNENGKKLFKMLQQNSCKHFLGYWFLADKKERLKATLCPKCFKIIEL